MIAEIALTLIILQLLATGAIIFYINWLSRLKCKRCERKMKKGELIDWLDTQDSVPVFFKPECRECRKVKTNWYDKN